jgi:hypothetical protein
MYALPQTNTVQPNERQKLKDDSALTFTGPVDRGEGAPFLVPFATVGPATGIGLFSLINGWITSQSRCKNA